MRKVLSFVLVLALVLGSFSMAFAATPTDVVGTPNAEAVQVLMGLGVVNGYTDGSFKPAGIVTRAEMAKLIVVALGLQDYATGTSKFADMAGADWAQGYVNYAAGLGIIKGYPDGTFKPSQTVSYGEAAAMIVRSLGFTDASLLPATWPANYVVKAKSLDIFKDVNKAITAGATRGDIAQMLYNTLDLAIGSIDKDGVWVASSTDTMLDRLGATLNAKSIITGSEDSQINLRAHVGAYAETYTNSDDSIITVKDSSTFLKGKWDGSTFTANSVDYTFAVAPTTVTALTYNNDTTTPVAAKVFVNGKIGTLSALAQKTTYTMAVKLSGKTIKEIYSIDKWTHETGQLYTSTDFAEITAENSLFGIKFTLDDNSAIDYNSFELFGAASLKDIKVDNVVDIYKNSSNKITRIEVGTGTVTGKVTEINSDGDYVINGTAYSLAAGSLSIDVGDTGTARLDYNGDLFDWTKTDSISGNYAIIKDKDIVAETSFANCQLKLVTKDGTTSVFDVALNADLTKQQEGVTTNTTLGALATVGGLVEFSTDKNGVIDTLNFLNYASHVITAGSKVSVSGKVIDGKTIDSSVVIFTRDAATVGAITTATTYDVAKLADVTDIALTYAYYSLDGGSKIKVLIVKDTQIGASDTFAVLNTTGTALDADGYKVLRVDGFVDGKAFSAKTTKGLYTDATLNGLAFVNPALFQLKINADGIITAATPVSSGATVTGGLARTTVGAIVAAKDGNTLVNLGSTSVPSWVSVSSNAVVYQLNANAADLEYTVKTMGSVNALSEVTMYQIDKDSDGYDLIIVKVTTAE